jgi:hypothetical protein
MFGLDGNYDGELHAIYATLYEPFTKSKYKSSTSFYSSFVYSCIHKYRESTSYRVNYTIYKCRWYLIIARHRLFMLINERGHMV